MIDYEIIEKVKNKLVTTYSPLEIYFFGSYAYGTPDEESDLDLLIVVSEAESDRHAMQQLPLIEQRKA